ncbi:hypothetical protein BC829DRAFT_389202 [Chytridium lagenaria]|nr:hypothetical protein BC829DRAFT_389202 [Chytridium lagenaria]
MLSNNTCIRITLEKVRNRFLKLFKRKVAIPFNSLFKTVLHNYTDYIEVADISCASRNAKDIIFEYERQN